DLLAELIQEDRSIRSDYLQQLSLKEITSVIKVKNEKVGEDTSSSHRISIEDEDDILLFKNHLEGKLLPNCSLEDVITVLKDLAVVINNIDIKIGKNRFRENSNLPKIFWIILDSVVQNACLKQFWLNNKKDTNKYYNWCQMLKSLRQLLPFSLHSIIPEYIPELLCLLLTDFDSSNVYNWSVIIAANNIAPTIVEKYIGLNERKKCLGELEQLVESALSDADSYDLESNYSESNEWHNTYESIPDECLEYEFLFPSDEIVGDWRKVEEIIDDFPRLEDEPDYDEDREYRSSHSIFNEDKDIKELFSDL
ncbi:MAG: hypothetical protein ACYSR0_12525, partial [Planctomycetota bacterium]